MIRYALDWRGLRRLRIVEGARRRAERDANGVRAALEPVTGLIAHRRQKQRVRLEGGVLGAGEARARELVEGGLRSGERRIAERVENCGAAARQRERCGGGCVKAARDRQLIAGFGRQGEGVRRVLRRQLKGAADDPAGQ